MVALSIGVTSFDLGNFFKVKWSKFKIFNFEILIRDRVLVTIDSE